MARRSRRRSKSSAKRYSAVPRRRRSSRSSSRGLAGLGGSLFTMSGLSTAALIGAGAVFTPVIVNRTPFVKDLNGWAKIAGTVGIAALIHRFLGSRMPALKQFATGMAASGIATGISAIMSRNAAPAGGVAGLGEFMQYPNDAYAGLAGSDSQTVWDPLSQQYVNVPA